MARQRQGVRDEDAKHPQEFSGQPRHWDEAGHDRETRGIFVGKLYITKKHITHFLKKPFQLAHKLSTTPPEGFSKSMFGSINDGKSESEKFFSQWLREVQSYVPKNRLLLFSVKDG